MKEEKTSAPSVIQAAVNSIRVLFQEAAEQPSLPQKEIPLQWDETGYLTLTLVTPFGASCSLDAQMPTATHEGSISVRIEEMPEAIMDFRLSQGVQGAWLLERRGRSLIAKINVGVDDIMQRVPRALERLQKILHFLVTAYQEEAAERSIARATHRLQWIAGVERRLYAELETLVGEGRVCAKEDPGGESARNHSIEPADPNASPLWRITVTHKGSAIEPYISAHKESPRMQLCLRLHSDETPIVTIWQGGNLEEIAPREGERAEDLFFRILNTEFLTPQAV